MSSITSIGSGASAPDAPQAAQPADALAQEAQTLMDGSRQMGVLNAERLVQGLVKVAARDPGHAAKLRAEIEPQLAGADQQRLASEFSAAMKQQTIGGATDSIEQRQGHKGFFGREAALLQSHAFGAFNSRAWDAVDGIRADPGQPGWVRDIVSLSQPLMAVGLGALGLANDVATAIKDPSLIAEPLLHPIDSAVAVQDGIADFFRNPNPFRQGQALITNFADPAMAGVHVAAELGRLSHATADFGKTFASEAGQALRHRYADGSPMSLGSLAPRGLNQGADLLFPNFNIAFDAIPRSKNGYDSRLVTSLPLVSRDEFGAKLGQGTRKEVYEFGDLAIGVARKPGFNSELLFEADILGELRSREVLATEAKPVRVEDELGTFVGLVYPRYLAGTKDFGNHVPQHDPQYIFEPRPYLNARTLDDLRHIRSALNREGLALGDLQSLFGAEGQAVMADPSALIDLRNTDPAYRRFVYEETGYAMGKYAGLQDDYFDALSSAIKLSIKQFGP